MYSQRSIVKIEAKLPDGKIATHPFLIINCRAAQGSEKTPYYTGVMLTHSNGNGLYTFPLSKEMIDGRWEEVNSQIRLYIIVSFSHDEIKKDSFLGHVKLVHFKEIIRRIKDYVFSID